MQDDLWDKAKSLSSFRAKVIRLSGPVRNSQHDLTMMYVGNGTNLPFVSRTVFGARALEQEIGRCNIWAAGRTTAIHASSTDMIVIDVPWPYDVAIPDDKRIIEIPAWVRQETRLADTWKGVLANLRKSVRDSQLRKIRKYKLAMMTTNDSVAVDRFYDTMYVPHIVRRFGRAASVESRKDVQKCVSGGTLLSVLRDDEAIGACVLLDKGESLQMLFVGFSEGDLREIDGASAGLYYFTLSYAFESGYKKVDFCGSRPFLDDGVLAIKRRWGAGIFDDWSLENLLIQLNRLSPGVESFLKSHPMITCQGDELVGKVLVGEGALTSDLAGKMSRQYISAGVDRLNIYSLHGIREDAFDAVKSGSVPVELIDLGDSSDPLTTYCRE